MFPKGCYPNHDWAEGRWNCSPLTAGHFIGCSYDRDTLLRRPAHQRAGRKGRDKAVNDLAGDRYASNDPFHKWAAKKQKKTPTFHYTAWLIGILILVPCITQPAQFFSLLKWIPKIPPINHWMNIFLSDSRAEDNISVSVARDPLNCQIQSMVVSGSPKRW